MLRMSEYLSACLASSGSSSPMRMPGTLVAIGFVQRAAVVVARGRLRIEGVQVRRPAGQPDLDHRLGLGLDGVARRPGAGDRPSSSPAAPARPRASPRAGRSTCRRFDGLVVHGLSSFAKATGADRLERSRAAACGFAMHTGLHCEAASAALFPQASILTPPASSMPIAKTPGC